MNPRETAELIVKSLRRLVDEHGANGGGNNFNTWEVEREGSNLTAMRQGKFLAPGRNRSVLYEAGERLGLHIQWVPRNGKVHAHYFVRELSAGDEGPGYNRPCAADCAARNGGHICTCHGEDPKCASCGAILMGNEARGETCNDCLGSSVEVERLRGEVYTERERADRLQAELKDAERKVEELARFARTVYRKGVATAKQYPPPVLQALSDLARETLESTGMMLPQDRPELIPEAWKPEVQSRDEAEEEGRQAARDRLSRDVNFFPEGSPEAIAFDDGWFDETGKILDSYEEELDEVLEPAVAPMSYADIVYSATRPVLWPADPTSPDTTAHNEAVDRALAPPWEHGFEERANEVLKPVTQEELVNYAAKKVCTVGGAILTECYARTEFAYRYPARTRLIPPCETCGSGTGEPCANTEMLYCYGCNRWHTAPECNVLGERESATASAWEPHDPTREGPVFRTQWERYSDPCEDCHAEAGEPCRDNCPSMEDSR